MQPLLLESFSFWDVVWWMIIVFFATMFIWMFIAVFADIFRRRMSGWAKAGWIALIFLAPLLGILLYIIFRPPVTEADVQMMEQTRRASGISPSEEIARAQQLRDSGSLTEQEFQQIKQRALGSV